jgi:hypothetical protein
LGLKATLLPGFLFIKALNSPVSSMNAVQWTADATVLHKEGEMLQGFQQKPERAPGDYLNCEEEDRFVETGAKTAPLREDQP